MTPYKSTRAYPWLLLLSTSVSGLFCLMYISKPEFYLTKTVPTPMLTIAAKQTTPLQAPANEIAARQSPTACFQMPQACQVTPTRPHPARGAPKPPTTLRPLLRKPISISNTC